MTGSRSNADILERCRLPGGGRLGPFTFARDDRRKYWRVHGPVPLDVAMTLYNDPLGREDIRVAGHAGCPPPEDPWLTWRLADGRQVGSVEDGRTARRWELMKGIDFSDYVFTDDRSQAQAFVESYHIDSEAGLRVFADAIRELACTYGQLRARMTP